MVASKTFAQIGVLGLYTETPLHCGAEGGTGYVDLPVQRERHTNYPVIPGSTIKGVLRDELLEALGEASIHVLFGAEEDKKSERPGAAGSVSFGDGILVAFPIRSSGAPFHWVTCPFVLERVFRCLGADLTVKGPEKGYALSGGNPQGNVLLEEISLTKKSDPTFFGEKSSGLRLLQSLLPQEKAFDYTRRLFAGHLLIVTDADFKELVETGTEILTRIKLNFLGTTVNLDKAKLPEEERKRPDSDYKGNLFVEEVVPPETLFLAPLRVGSQAEAFAETLQKERVIRLKRVS
ncbi:MAG: type III-B CRISPR module RAMP protein Cmr4 [Acidobacteria bacterium]|nr:MAG: type III-B CRISPR module RAMP protein Cmr4 [Acidobacteriota bacterium]